MNEVQSEQPDCAHRMHGYGFTFRGAPCSRKAKVERDGKWYCGIHDPVKVAERRNIRDARYAEESKRQAAVWRLQSAAPEMLAALKAVADLYSWTDETAVAATPRQVLNAIAKAEGR